MRGRRPNRCEAVCERWLQGSERKESLRCGSRFYQERRERFCGVVRGSMVTHEGDDVCVRPLACVVTAARSRGICCWWVMLPRSGGQGRRSNRGRLRFGMQSCSQCGRDVGRGASRGGFIEIVRGCRLRRKAVVFNIPRLVGSGRLALGLLRRGWLVLLPLRSLLSCCCILLLCCICSMGAAALLGLQLRCAAAE